MGEEQWKAVGIIQDNNAVCKSSDNTIDWKAEKDYKLHSNTKSVHVSYRYSINMLKRK